MSEIKQIRDLIERLSRVASAEEWNEDINPSQWAALVYLSNANKFSRSPSQVAEYMSATRGTVSQTLKALARKGLIKETPSENDKRSISYSVSHKAAKIIQNRKQMDETFASLDKADLVKLANGLEALTRSVLKQRGMREFGVCKNCTYHEKTENGGYCNLLNVKLNKSEIEQICHEYSG